MYVVFTPCLKLDDFPRGAFCSNLPTVVQKRVPVNFLCFFHLSHISIRSGHPNHQTCSNNKWKSTHEESPRHPLSRTSRTMSANKSLLRLSSRSSRRPRRKSLITYAAMHHLDTSLPGLSGAITTVQPQCTQEPGMSEIGRPRDSAFVGKAAYSVNIRYRGSCYNTTLPRRYDFFQQVDEI